MNSEPEDRRTPDTTAARSDSQQQDPPAAPAPDHSEGVDDFTRMMWEEEDRDAEYMRQFLHDPGTAPDDPAASEYTEWHERVGRVVVTFGYSDPGSGERGPDGFYVVLNVRVSPRIAFVRVRHWWPPSPDHGRENWFGGLRFSMFGMSPRPDGGFQVAGDKFAMVGSHFAPTNEMIAYVAERVTPEQLAEFKSLLQRAAGPA